MSTIIDIVRHAIDNEPGGGTRALSGGPLPSWGYFVGGAGPLLVFQSEDRMREHWGMVESFVSAVYVHGYEHIGWWTDPETGKFYLDVSTWHESAITADQRADERGEIAFYGVEEQDSLKTGSTGAV